MKSANIHPAVDPWRTNSFADGTALGIVRGHTERVPLKMCADVVRASASRRLASPSMDEYFGDASRDSGMQRVLEPGQSEQVFENDGDIVREPGTGRVRVGK